MKGTIDRAGNVTITFNMQSEKLSAPGKEKHYLPCRACDELQIVDYNVISICCSKCCTPEKPENTLSEKEENHLKSAALILKTLSVMPEVQVQNAFHTTKREAVLHWLSTTTRNLTRSEQELEAFKDSLKEE